MLDAVLSGDARYHVECARSDDFMARLPAGCVNLAILDIPYFRAVDEDWDRAWPDAPAFLAWVGAQADEWRRVLAPNGTLYVFASPEMAWSVEGVIRARFEVLCNIRWAKPFSRAQSAEKEMLRSPFPASETVIMAEHQGSDQIALNRSGYAAKCDEARGFVFEPLRAYLDGERERAGLTRRQCDEACENQMAGHYFSPVQWTLPTRDNYEKIRTRAGAGFFERDYEALRADYEALRADYEALRADYEALRADYEALRADYEALRADYEALRADYEALRRPFAVSSSVPYTDVWTYPTVAAYPGKHPCEKPEKMGVDIVEASSRPGDLVADFYCGSGRFLGEAVKLGRRAIGCDLSEHWAGVAERRCDMAVATGQTRIRRIEPADPKQVKLFG